MAKEKKLKDLGGKKYKEFSSISAAQKAGSIYYGKKLKSGKIEKKAAVLSTDLSKGQSLRSFMNEKLKGSKSTGANYKVKGIGKVRPKLRPKSSIDVLEQTGHDKSKTILKVDTGRKDKPVIVLTNTNPIPIKKKSEVNANPKNNTYGRAGMSKDEYKKKFMGGGQRRAASTPIKISESDRKDLKTKLSFVKVLSRESVAGSTAAARYTSFSAKEKKLVKTLFNEGLTFKQAVAQVYGG